MSTGASINEMGDLTSSTRTLANVEDPETQPIEGKTGIPSPAKAIPRRRTGISWVIVVVAILSSTFLFALDNTVVADVQPKLILTFGEIDKLPWVAVAYGLGSMAVKFVLVLIPDKKNPITN
jgi:hypothetical protein